MRLIIIGCEYAGKTTLVSALSQWSRCNMGATWEGHDHFTIPHIDHHIDHGALTDDEQSQFLDLSPRIQEMFQRYGIEYHLQDAFYRHDDHVLVGYHIEEAIYSDLYYNYGIWGQEHDRWKALRRIEDTILVKAPDTILVLVKASSDEILRRMTHGPHKNGVVKPRDIKRVLQMFDEQHEMSRLRKKIILDTTDAMVDQTLAEFLKVVDPYLSDADRLRLSVHKAS